MPSLMELTGPSFAPAAGGPPRALIVLLHGWGADGHDLIGLAPHWAETLAHAEFLAPHGPFPGDMGMGRQWFSLQDRGPEAMLAGMKAVVPAVHAFLDEALEARGLGEEKLALVGFSQGTMISLHVALRRERACAGVLGYSGALLGDPAALAAETTARPPIVLVHGAMDEVVPAQAMAAAEAALRAAGLDVEAHLRPDIGHGIDPQGLAVGTAFLARVLPDAL